MIQTKWTVVLLVFGLNLAVCFGNALAQENENDEADSSALQVEKHGFD
jgi:hypothetical protein